jgi:hypothetical protein
MLRSEGAGVAAIATTWAATGITGPGTATRATESRWLSGHAGAVFAFERERPRRLAPCDPAGSR